MGNVVLVVMYQKPPVLKAKIEERKYKEQSQMHFLKIRLQNGHPRYFKRPKLRRSKILQMLHFLGHLQNSISVKYKNLAICKV